jgi:hypothetical protein
MSKVYFPFICRLFFDALRSSLDCTENDGEALFALCLIYAAIQNKGKIIYIYLFIFAYCNSRKALSKNS